MSKKRLPSNVSRRQALALIGTTGALLAHSGSRAIAQGARTEGTSGPSEVKMHRYPAVASLKAAAGLGEGEVVETAGYHAAGDGGGALYRIVTPGEGTSPNEGDVIALGNGLVAELLEAKAVNYRMFGAVGDGERDDGVQIKMAHHYAVKRGIPIINPSGEFWIKESNDIPITTHVHWGKTIFHVDERFNDKRTPRFVVRNDRPQETLDLDEATKAAVLRQLKPGVQIIPELAPYAGHLISVVDANDRIGLRAGAKFVGQGWSREELFYVETEGRILGDIAWEFKDFTSITAMPCNENYLVIEGGGFFLSGDNPGEAYTGYHYNGFSIQRSRTIIRQQWMGLERDRRDVSMEPRHGFYSLSRVYDVTLEDIRLIPWEQNRPDPEKKLGAGTYGIGGARMLNCTFRNLTAEGGWVAWGVFGTNINKNFRLENCRLNRVDVHFHCWNLYISDCTIGFRGISVTGGGELFIDNTTRHGDHFINFRRDFGARWDGHVRLRGCTLKPNGNGAVSVLYQRMADFDYQYPIGYARSIKIVDIVIDYSAAPESTGPCWLMNIVPFSRTKADTRLFFPYLAEFRNIVVEGRKQGVRLVNIPNPHQYDVGREGSYDGSRLTANSTLIFENIQLEKLRPENPGDPAQAHLLLGGSEPLEYADPLALYPKMRFVDCENLNLYLGRCIASVHLERCSVNTVHAPGLRGELVFSDCRFQPDVKEATENFWAVKSTLGTRFTNCTLHAPIVAGRLEPEMVNRIGFLKVNESLQHYHLNTALGNEVLDHWKEKGAPLSPEFVAKLKSHHELED